MTSGDGSIRDDAPERVRDEGMAGRIARIAVITVNYGTPDLVVAGVRSVLDRAPDGRDVEVHVVDNASPPPTSGPTDVERLRAAHAAGGWGSRVTIHAEPMNHGFGGGNNVVLAALLARTGGAGGAPDAAMLLNPDARLAGAGEAIDRLARALEADPRAGFAGPAIALPDGTPVTAAFRFPSLASEFADTLSVGVVARLVGRAVALPPDTPGGPVDWVSGAAPMIRMAALREVGIFDPAFFLYYEEVDLARRAARAGWRSIYVPEARVVHAEGVATGVRTLRGRPARPPRRPAYHYRSWATYHRKARGRGGALLAAVARLAGAAGNRAAALLPGRRTTVPEGIVRDTLRHGLATILAPTPADTGADAGTANGAGDGRDGERNGRRASAPRPDGQGA